jgi:hypothetical protein
VEVCYTSPAPLAWALGASDDFTVPLTSDKSPDHIPSLNNHLTCSILCGVTAPEDNIVDKGFVPVTDPALDCILAELTAREPIFHRPEFGTTRPDFERMIAEDFWEVGASGRQYSREQVLKILEQRFLSPHEDAWETSRFRCRRLSSDTYLLTYTLVQDRSRRTRRSTVWQSTPDGWKVVFHQGTLIQDSER